MSGKTSAAKPAEYIKKPEPEGNVNNGGAPDAEAEPVRFSPEEEAVSTAEHAKPPLQVLCTQSF